MPIHSVLRSIASSASNIASRARQSAFSGARAASALSRYDSTTSLTSTASAPAASSAPFTTGLAGAGGRPTILTRAVSFVASPASEHRPASTKRRAPQAPMSRQAQLVASRSPYLNLKPERPAPAPPSSTPAPLPKIASELSAFLASHGIASENPSVTNNSQPQPPGGDTPPLVNELIAHLAAFGIKPENAKKL